MKDLDNITMSQFFASGTKSSPKELTKAESDENIAKIKECICKEVKVLWPAACGFIIRELLSKLDTKIKDVLLDAWKQYEDIVKFTDEKEYPPDKKYKVSLVKHTIKSEHKPTVEILFDNQPTDPRIEFNVTLTLEIEGIVLEIQGGKIMNIETGSCKGGGTLKCKGLLILKRETKPFTLPGVIPLGKGIPIPKIPLPQIPV